MQLKLLVFPKATALLNALYQVFSDDATVYYLHCGQAV